MNKYVKMKDLCLKLNVSKSTILFYIKEGIFSEPKIINKQNHLYDLYDFSIKNQIVKLLQEKLNCSIEQIRFVMGELKIVSDNLIALKEIKNMIIRLSYFELKYNYEEMGDKIGNDFLELLINKNLIKNKTRYSDRDVENMSFYKKFVIRSKNDKLSFNEEDLELFNAYIKSAKEISIIEETYIENLIKKETKIEEKEYFINLERRYVGILETVLLNKNFIYNRETLNILINNNSI